MIIEAKQSDFPVIYIRYLGGVITYIGESQSFLSGRHRRDDPGIEDYDKIKILKASKFVERRRYWEAYLICKLEPKTQNSLRYRSFLIKKNGGTPESIEKARKISAELFREQTKNKQADTIEFLDKAWKIKLIESMEIKNKLKYYKESCIKD